MGGQIFICRVCVPIPFLPCNLVILKSPACLGQSSCPPPCAFDKFVSRDVKRGLALFLSLPFSLVKLSPLALPGIEPTNTTNLPIAGLMRIKPAADEDSVVSESVQRSPRLTLQITNVEDIVFVLGTCRRLVSAASDRESNKLQSEGTPA
jgi:hypothetical protein